uniref:Equistatin-like n=1 Tax=Oncorhynchus kisutch TaxID=8019 RepID=A0A8C7CXR2_ONCKI
MVRLTIILLFSMAFALGDATIQPKTPCERARDAAIKGPIGAYIPTCDAAGQYTPKQCSGSTGYCWCVTSTGQKIPGTETPPGTAPIKCPCSFDPVIRLTNKELCVLQAQAWIMAGKPFNKVIFTDES